MKIDRLLTILAILLEKEQVTTPQLARCLEVTTRTIRRDIDDLCKAGFPIVTRQGVGGGISIAEGYKLDKSLLRKDELENILIGLKGLESVDGESHIKNLLQKLSPKQDRVVPVKDCISIDLSSHYRSSLSEKIKILKTAIENNRIVTFDYYSNKGVGLRIIEPYFMVYRWSDWYLYGYCMDRWDFRMFKLNRLWKLVVTEDTFKERPIPHDKLDLDAHFINNGEMIILFDKSVEYLLVEVYGPDSYKETSDGRLYFKSGYTNRDYIIGWILSFGHKAEVISPPELKEEIREEARKMLVKYNKFFLKQDT